MGYFSRPQAGNQTVEPVRRPALAGPLYLQILENLRARIAAGEWSSNTMLPNEVDLARDYGVSIGTMRKALDRLGQARLIVRKQGRGTYVRKLAADPLARFSRWHAKESERAASNERVLTAKVMRPSGIEAQRLRLSRSDDVLKIETLGTMGSNCVVFNTYTLMQRSSDAGLEPARTIHDAALERIKMATNRAERCVDRVTAAKANATEAALLHISEGDPVLCIARAGLDADHRSIFLCDSVAHVSKDAAYSPDID